MNRYYIGTELKFALTITSEGFSMDTDNWKATVRCGSNTIECDSTHNSSQQDDQWYILIDTQELGTGEYYLIVEIDVPDSDFDDDLRHEVLKQEKPLCIVYNT